MNTTSRYYPSQPAIHEQDLPPAALRVLDYLEKRTRGLTEWWESAATIAAKLSRFKAIAERTVQAALKALREAGLIDYATNYGLKTRRAIVMLWRVNAQPSESVSQPSESQAKSSESAHAVDRAEPDADPLPKAASRAEAEAPREPEAPEAAAVPVEAGEVTKTGRKATPEEVAKLIEDARRLRGSDPASVKALCKLHTFSVVRAAVSFALANGKQTWVWAMKAAAGWSREGVPDYAKPKATAITEEQFAEMSRRCDELLARLPKLSDAEVDAHWDRVLKSNEWYLNKVAGHLEIFK